MHDQPPVFPWLSRSQALRQLGVSRATLERLIVSGDLRPVYTTLGRLFKPEDVEALRQQRKAKHDLAATR